MHMFVRVAFSAACIVTAASIATEEEPACAALEGATCASTHDTAALLQLSVAGTEVKSQLKVDSRPRDQTHSLAQGTANNNAHIKADTKLRGENDDNEVDHRLTAVHEAALNVVHSEKSDVAAAARRILAAVKNGSAYEDLIESDIEEVEAEHASQGQTAETAFENGDLVYAKDIDAQGGGVAAEDKGTNGSYQGDMVPGSPAQLLLFQEITSGKRGGQVAAGTPWAKGVQYCYAPDVPHNIRHVMDVAMAQYKRAVPCISWENVGHQSGTSTSPKEEQRCKSHPAIFIMSDPKGGCYSYVGNVGWQSHGQQLQMQADGCASVGTAIHELGHALGMAHEQSRPDRDNYVKIHWNNIQKSSANNFEISSGAYDDIAYDFLSIMHYSPYAFAIDRSKPTITKTGAAGSGHDGIGQRSGLSSYDVHQMEVMYKEVDPSCASNPLEGMGCVNEPNDDGDDICTGIKTCSGETIARCCGCGGGTKVQCYKGSPCPKTEKLPPSPEANCVQAEMDGGTCWYTRRGSCDQDKEYVFKCPSHSCEFSIGQPGWWSSNCGGEPMTEICTAPTNCLVWSKAR